MCRGLISHINHTIAINILCRPVVYHRPLSTSASRNSTKLASTFASLSVSSVTGGELHKAFRASDTERKGRGGGGRGGEMGGRRGVRRSRLDSQISWHCELGNNKIGQCGLTPQGCCSRGCAPPSQSDRLSIRLPRYQPIGSPPPLAQRSIFPLLPSELSHYCAG